MTAASLERDGTEDDAYVDFAVETVSGDGHQTVVARGELDLATSPLLRAVLEGACRRGPASVELDLSQVTFLDASAVGMLTTVARSLAAHRRTLVLRDPGTVASRVLTLTGYDGAVRVTGTRRPGLGAREPVSGTGAA